MDEDRIFVRKKPFRNVKIEGAVIRPGNYKMTEGQSVFDLIEAAGGYTQNAFPQGAIYLNEEAKTEVRARVTKRAFMNESQINAIIENANAIVEAKNDEPFFMTAIPAEYKEKFEGGVLSPRDGALYCIPMRAKTLVKVVPGEVDSLS